MKMEKPGRRPVVAILGGGFTGAATAYHLARSAAEAEIVVVEPRPVLGAGLAYSTEDPAHRINVPASRMSLLPEDPDHFMKWLAAESISMSPGTLTLAGEFFPERRLFGRYVAAQMAPYLANRAIRHVATRAESVRRSGDGFVVKLAGGDRLAASHVVLAMTHPAPSRPPELQSVQASRRLIADPFDAARIGAIPDDARVLIVGTGLTAADVIASLDRRGFRGRITAVSRHGLRPRAHESGSARSVSDFVHGLPLTATALVRSVRTMIGAEGEADLGWRAVIEQLREEASDLWTRLDMRERSRMVRHLRRYWDVHRFHMAPAVEAVIDALERRARLEWVAARLEGATEDGGGVVVRFRPRGSTAAVAERFDAVVIATGPDHASVIGTNPALRSLEVAGEIIPDPLGLGLAVSDGGRAVSAGGNPASRLFVAGPLARGSFGELTGLPEVARHAAQVAALLQDELPAVAEVGSRLAVGGR